jgi:hypothetical protein
MNHTHLIYDEGEQVELLHTALILSFIISLVFTCIMGCMIGYIFYDNPIRRTRTSDSISVTSPSPQSSPSNSEIQFYSFPVSVSPIVWSIEEPIYETADGKLTKHAEKNNTLKSLSSITTDTWTKLKQQW